MGTVEPLPRQTIEINVPNPSQVAEPTNVPRPSYIVDMPGPSHKPDPTHTRS